jgi:hypothetical protein
VYDTTSEMTSNASSANLQVSKSQASLSSLAFAKVRFKEIYLYVIIRVGITCFKLCRMINLICAVTISNKTSRRVSVVCPSYCVIVLH